MINKISFPRNILDKKREIIFLKHKYYKDGIYICCFDLAELKNSLDELSPGKMMTPEYYKNVMFYMYNSILCFNINDNFSRLEYCETKHYLFNIIKDYNIYHPSEEEIQKIKTLYKDFIKIIRKEKENKIKEKLKNNYRTIIDIVKKSEILYKNIKKHEKTDKIIQKTSENFIIFYELCKTKSQRKILKYVKEFQIVETDDEIYFIKGLIASNIYNNKPFSITRTNIKKCHEIYIIMERKYKNKWYLYFEITPKYDKEVPLRKVIIINKNETITLDKTIENEIIEPIKIVKNYG